MPDGWKIIREPDTLATEWLKMDGNIPEGAKEAAQAKEVEDEVHIDRRDTKDNPKKNIINVHNIFE